MRAQRQWIAARTRAAMAVGLPLVAAVAAGCANDHVPIPAEASPSTTTAGGGGAGGSGGGATSTTTTTGAGGGGGEPGPCLAPEAYAAAFSLDDPELCVVAMYEAADLVVDYAVAPTWGRHGGPLTVHPAPDGSVSLVRWTAPAGATGAMTSASTTAPAEIPDGAFLGAQAIDLPFFTWTLVSYTTAGFTGEVILIANDAVERRYGVNGFFSGAGIAAAAEQGRLVYSGLSIVGDTVSMTNGLYAADSCGAAGQSPRLLPEGDTDCGAPTPIASWGDFSGPVAVDADGNVLAVLPSFAGSQEVRGFPAGAVARGAGATAGSALFELPGSGTSLAAISPDAGSSGWITFQPTDPTTFAPLDVVASRYAASETEVSISGEPVPLLSLATAGTLLSLMSDDQDRLWIGAPGPGGGSIFLVIDRAP